MRTGWRRAACSVFGSARRPVESVALLPLLESGALLISRQLEARARVGVLAARAPVAAAARRGAALHPLQPERLARLLGRVPDTAAVEPLQRHPGLGTLELGERRQEILLLPGAEGRRRRAVDDHPEAVLARHQRRSSRFIFSMSVVRFR
jgi:hypothetical protein